MESRKAFAKEKNAMVTERFAKWAVEFSGCDGGDPRGIWLCGIEFGQGHTEENLNLEEDLSKPGYVGGNGWECWEMKEFPKRQYNQKALKLLCALAGHDVTKYREFYEAKRCFGENSGYFKLALLNPECVMRPEGARFPT